MVSFQGSVRDAVFISPPILNTSRCPGLDIGKDMLFVLNFLASGGALPIFT